MESDKAAAVGASAEGRFRSGLYCAESVVLALAEAQGLDDDLLTRAATAFCGGMARTCGPCGAVTGALMGLGLAFGRAQPGLPVQPAYDAAQRLIRGFEGEFGSRECRELLGCDLGTPQGQAAFRERNLMEQCARYTARAAELAARLLEEEGRLAPAPRY